MVLDHTHDTILLRQLDEIGMMRQELRGRFRDENVQLALQGVFGDRVMCAVRSEDNDSLARRHLINGSLV